MVHLLWSPFSEKPDDGPCKDVAASWWDSGVPILGQSRVGTRFLHEANSLASCASASWVAASCRDRETSWEDRVEEVQP